MAQAGFRDVETRTVLVIFETDSPEQYTEFIRDVAPQLTTLLSGQPATVVERVWNRVTDAYRRFQGADGRSHRESSDLVQGSQVDRFPWTPTGGQGLACGSPSPSRSADNGPKTHASGSVGRCLVTRPA